MKNRHFLFSIFARYLSGYGFRSPLSGICLLVTVFPLLFTGCGPEVKREVQPVMNPAVYIVPDWNTKNSERNAAAAEYLTDVSVNLFLTPIPSGFQNSSTCEFPEKSTRMEFPGVTIICIVLKDNSGFIPFDMLKNTSETDIPSVAVIKGLDDEKTVQAVTRELSPDAYVFLSDHYEQREDISGAPAVYTGSSSFSHPFAGEFPHLIKIEMNDTPVIRPVDCNGFLLKSDTVTSVRISRLKDLIRQFSISFNVEGWHEGVFVKEIEISLTNRFEKELSLELESKKNGPWNVQLPQSPFSMKPGEKKILRIRLSAESVEKLEPGPDIAYSITVGGESAASGTFPVAIHKIKAPE